MQCHGSLCFIHLWWNGNWVDDPCKDQVATAQGLWPLGAGEDSRPYSHLGTELERLDRVIEHPIAGPPRQGLEGGLGRQHPSWNPQDVAHLLVALSWRLGCEGCPGSSHRGRWTLHHVAVEAVLCF